MRRLRSFINREIEKSPHIAKKCGLFSCGVNNTRIELLPILTGRQPGIFFKYPAEVALISEARGNGNVDDGVVGICQKPFALFDADHI